MMPQVMCGWDTCKNWTEEGCNAESISLEASKFNLVSQGGKKKEIPFEILECENYELAPEGGVK